MWFLPFFPFFFSFFLSLCVCLLVSGHIYHWTFIAWHISEDLFCILLIDLMLVTGAFFLQVCSPSLWHSTTTNDGSKEDITYIVIHNNNNTIQSPVLSTSSFGRTRQRLRNGYKSKRVHKYHSYHLSDCTPYEVLLLVVLVTPYWAEIMKLQKMQKITAAEIRS